MTNDDRRDAAGGIEPEPWVVTASRRVIDDRWIHLRADDCVDAAGRSIAPYYVLEQPEWVSVVALTVRGEVVVVREYRHGSATLERGLPGGAVDPGESPLAAAQRELAEETGYVSDDWIDLGSSWVNPANQSNRVHFRLARGATPQREQALDPGELISVSTAALDGLVDEIEHSLHRLALFAAERWLSRQAAL